MGAESFKEVFVYLLIYFISLVLFVMLLHLHGLFYIYMFQVI